MYFNRVFARFIGFFVLVLVVAVAVLQTAPWLPREMALVSGFVVAASVFSRSARRFFFRIARELSDVLVAIVGLMFAAFRSSTTKTASARSNAAKADVVPAAQPIYNPIPSGTWAAEKAAADAERQAWLKALESQGARRERAMSVLRAAMTR